MRSLWLLGFALGVAAAGGAEGGGGRVSAELSSVWGPGLRAAAVLPARYFFVLALDAQGRR